MKVAALFVPFILKMIIGSLESGAFCCSIFGVSGIRSFWIFDVWKNIRILVIMMTGNL